MQWGLLILLYNSRISYLTATAVAFLALCDACFAQDSFSAKELYKDTPNELPQWRQESDNCSKQAAAVEEGKDGMYRYKKESKKCSISVPF